MYISVSEAAEKFNISKRRVQLLCEQGRIKDAVKKSGVWLIPNEVEKPDDARKKEKKSLEQIKLFNGFCGNDEILSISQVCDILSVSQATVKNWIRLGKIKTNQDGKTFNRKYIDSLLLEISTDEKRLKSRRNKKKVNGTMLYKDYIKSVKNQEIVIDVLNACEKISEDELRVILANFAIKLYDKSGGNILLNGNLLEERSIISDNIVFNALIEDLLQNIDLSEINFKHIQYALDSEIEFVPLDDTLGFIYISFRDLNARKQFGAYYTPEDTVNELIDNLEICLDIKDKKICDPCCGTGNFLIKLKERGVKIENIYGQDIDQVSIFITRINMFLLDNNVTYNQLNSHFICDNTLVNTFSETFSIILGNPPWGYSFSKDEISYLISRYSTAKNKGTESYDLFVEKGLAMLGDNGYLAFVLPEALLSVASHQKVRSIILKHTDFRFVSYLGDAFSGVQCPSIILGVQNSGVGRTENCRIKLRNDGFIIKTNRTIDDSLFSFNVNDDEYNCLKEIDSISNANYLLNNAQFALGIVTGNNKEYIKNVKENGMEIILKGSDIYRYGIKEPNNYIFFSPERFQQVAPSQLYRAKEKLFYRFISEVPVFAYDNSQKLSLNSCNILIPQIEGLDIKYILGILNSSVSAFFIHKKFNSIKLLKSHIESLPIPMVTHEVQSLIIKKVDQLMNSNENISDLYESLDQDVMDIFSLSNKSRKLIKNNMKGKNLFLK